MCVCAWPAILNTSHDVQTGVYFKRVEVDQLVAREPHLCVDHVTLMLLCLVSFFFIQCPVQESYIYLELFDTLLRTY